MKILLVSATQFEILPLLEKLGGKFQLKANNTYHNNANEIKVLLTGVGLTHTAFALGWTLSSYRPDLCINAGLAGSFDKNLKLGDVVNVVAQCFGDLGVEEKDGSFTDMFELGLLKHNEMPFVNGRLYNAEISGFDFLPSVRSISVNKVHGYIESIDKIVAKYQPDIESMEGAAFFFSCLQAKIPFLEIRGISNYVEPRNRENWCIGPAIDNLNATVMDIIELLTSEAENDQK
jgi:futalosine hydrolase